MTMPNKKASTVEELVKASILSRSEATQALVVDGQKKEFRDALINRGVASGKPQRSSVSFFNTPKPATQQPTPTVQPTQEPGRSGPKAGG